MFHVSIDQLMFAYQNILLLWYNDAVLEAYTFFPNTAITRTICPITQVSYLK
jgi:hypothetical protein